MVYSINHNTERNADRNTEELKNLKPNSTQLVQLITWSIRWATVFRCSVVFKYCSIIVYQQSICCPICIQSQQQCCGMVRMCWYSTECRGRDTSIRLPVFKYKFNRLSAPVLGSPIVPPVRWAFLEYPNTVWWKIRRNTKWNTRSENQQWACSHWNTGSRRLAVPYRGLTM